jgi:hypothetical protein
VNTAPTGSSFETRYVSLGSLFRYSLSPDGFTSFHLPSGVLFSFHSRYYCAIGLGECLGFGVHAPGLPTEFPIRRTLCSGITLVPSTTGLSPSSAPCSKGKVFFPGRTGFAASALRLPLDFPIGFPSGHCCLAGPHPGAVRDIAIAPISLSLPRNPKVPVGWTVRKVGAASFRFRGDCLTLLPRSPCRSLDASSSPRGLSAASCGAVIGNFLPPFPEKVRSGDRFRPGIEAEAEFGGGRMHCCA